MLYFFFGFLLVFLDYPIALAYGGALNLIPDFLGYGLLLLAGRRLVEENAHFRRLTIGARIALFLSLAEFALNLLPLSLPTPVTLLADIAVTLASLYISFEFAEGAKAYEHRRYKKMDAEKISAAWLILCMASILQYIMLYLPAVALPSLLLFLLAVVWFCSATLRFEKMLTKGQK